MDPTPLRNELELMAKDILGLHIPGAGPVPRVFWLGLSPKSNYNVPRDLAGSDIMDRIHHNRLKLLENGLENITILQPYLFKSCMKQYFVEYFGEIASESELGAQAWMRTIVRDIGKRYGWHKASVVKEISMKDYLSAERQKSRFQNRRQTHGRENRRAQNWEDRRDGRRDVRREDRRVEPREDRRERDPLDDLSRNDLQSLLSSLLRSKQHK